MEGKSMTTWQNKKGFQKIWWRLKSKTGKGKGLRYKNKLKFLRERLRFEKPGKGKILDWKCKTCNKKSKA